VIRTDRQLTKSREQLEMLQAALDRPAAHDLDVHPVLAEASRRALSAQANDLLEEIEEYEALRGGRAEPPDLSHVGQLHRTLVRARIAAGLSQTELAKRLNIDPQQVQRYEANDYAGASLARLQDIAAALGAVGPDRGPGAIDDEPSLRKRLGALGLPAAAARRLVPHDPRPQAFSRTAALTAAALGVEVEELLAAQQPVLAAARPGFKIPANAAVPGVAAYATYARVLAGLVAAGSRPGNAALPATPDAVHDALAGPGGVPFRRLLDYAWEHGIAVLPLKDPGAFHAAFWDVDGQAVVVLKQGARSADRWAFDLAHEMSHAADHLTDRRRLPEGIVDDETVAGWADDPEEQRANRFAGRVLLGRRADELASTAASLAGRRADRLKAAVADVAARNGVSPGALANHVAFRLVQEGVDWWGAATNLQSRDEDPWQVARDELLARLDFARLDEQSRTLLVQALAE